MITKVTPIAQLESKNDKGEENVDVLIRKKSYNSLKQPSAKKRKAYKDDHAKANKENWWDFKVNLATVSLSLQRTTRNTEYVAVLTLLHEDAIELWARGTQYQDLVIGRRVTNQVPGRCSLTPGALNGFLVSFDQILWAPSALLTADTKKLSLKTSQFTIWIFRLSYPSEPSSCSDDIFTQKSGHFDEQDGTLCIASSTDDNQLNIPIGQKFSHVESIPVACVAKDVTSSQHFITHRKRPCIDLIGLCFIDEVYFEDEIVLNKKSRTTGQNGIVKPLFASVSESLPFKTFNIHNAYALSLLNSFAVPKHLVPNAESSKHKILGTLTCRVVLSRTQLPPLPLQLLLPNVNENIKANTGDVRRPLVRGIFLRVLRISNVPLEFFKFSNENKKNGTIFLSIQRPQRLLLQWKSSLSFSKRSLDRALSPDNNLMLDERDDEGNQWSSSHVSTWGTRVIWSTPDVQLGPLIFSDRQGFNGKLTLDFVFDQTVYLTLPSTGDHLIQCLFYIEAYEEGQKKPYKTVKVQLKTPINVSQLISSQLDATLILKNSTTPAGVLRLTCYREPPTGEFLKPGIIRSDALGSKKKSLLSYNDGICSTFFGSSIPDFYSNPVIRFPYPSLSALPIPPSHLFSPYSVDHQYVPLDFYEIQPRANNDNLNLMKTQLPTNVSSNENYMLQPPIPVHTIVLGGNPVGGIVGVRYNLVLKTIDTDTNKIIDLTNENNFALIQQSISEQQQQQKNLVQSKSTKWHSTMSILKQRSEEFTTLVKFDITTAPNYVHNSKINNIQETLTMNIAEANVFHKGQLAPRSITTIWDVTTHEDSTCCTLYYTVMEFLMNVTLSGVHIAGSPFPVIFTAGLPDPMASRFESNRQPPLCFACPENLTEFESHLCLPTNKHLDEKRWQQVKSELETSAAMLSNELILRLYDTHNCPLCAGGHFVSAQGSTPYVEVDCVTDNNDGTYTIKYRVIYPYKMITEKKKPKIDRMKYEPKLGIYLNEFHIFGSPFLLIPQNIEELEILYTKLHQHLLPLTTVQTVEKELVKGNVSNALNIVSQFEKTQSDVIQKLCSEVSITRHIVDEQNNTLSILPEIEQVLTASKENSGDFSSLPDAYQCLENLSQRWLNDQVFRDKLHQFHTALKKNIDCHGALGDTLWNYGARLCQMTDKLMAELYSLRKLKSECLQPVAAYYQQAYLEHSRKLTRDLIYLVDKINEKNFSSIEEVASLHRHLADELRKLQRFELADIIEELRNTIVEEINLKAAQASLKWQQEKADQFEKILREKEMNLQFVRNNYKESLRCLKENEDENESDILQIWKLPIFTEDAACQTEDPFNALDTILGPMIVFRATGTSPAPALPSDIQQLQNLARGVPMDAKIKPFWYAPLANEILVFDKILKNCPRIITCIEEVFHCLAGSTPKTLRLSLAAGKETPGVTWAAFKRFCQNVNLNSSLLSDTTALRHLFFKCSIEYKKSMSSSMGYVRTIPLSLWKTFLRELAHLDTLYTIFDTNANILQIHSRQLNNRLTTFYYFMKHKFVSFYQNRLPFQSQQFFKPLSDLPKNKKKMMTLLDKQKENENSADLPLITSKNHLSSSMLTEITRYLDVKKLQQQFYTLVENTPNVPSSEPSEFTKKLSIHSFILFCQTLGLIPGYLSFNDINRILEKEANVTGSLNIYYNGINLNQFIQLLSLCFIETLEISEGFINEPKGSERMIYQKQHQLISLLKVLGVYRRPL